MRIGSHRLGAAGLLVAAVAMLAAGGAAYLAARLDAPRLKADLAALAQEKYRRALRIDGDIAWSLWPNLEIRAGRLSLSEPDGTAEFAAIDALRVAIAPLPLLSGRIEVRGAEFAGVRASLVRFRDGRLNIADLIPADDPDSPPLRLDFAGAKIAAERLSWRDEVSGTAFALADVALSSGRIQVDTGARTHRLDDLALAATVPSASPAGAGRLRLDLGAPRLTVAAATLASERLTLSATLDDPERRIAARLALADVQASASGANVAQAALDLDARLAGVHIEGRLETPLVADGDKATLALEKIVGRFAIAHPRMTKRRLQLAVEGSARAGANRPMVAGQLAARFDGSALGLKFDMSSLAPPAVNFALDIDRLALDDYLPADAGKPTAADAGGIPGVDALKGIEARGTVSIGRLRLAGASIDNLRLRIRAANGRIKVEPARGGFARK